MMTRRRPPWLLAAALAAVPLAGANAAERWSQAPVPAWVEPVAVPTEATIPANDVSSGLHYLLADHQASVASGTSERYHHWAWKVLSASGLEQASELRIRFDPSYQRLLVHHVRLTRDGLSVGTFTPRDVKIIQHEEDLDQRIYDESLTALVFLKDVRPGDVLDYAYTIQGQNPILEGRFAARLPLGYSVPVSLVRHRILWPAGRTLRHKGHRTTIEPRTETARDGRTTYVWERRDVPAIVREDRLPAWHDPDPWVQVSEFASWAEVASWAERLFAAETRSSPALERLVEEWRRLPTEEERARAAVRMVQDEIRYLGIESGPNSHRPHSPAQVLGQRFGDCKDKALLLALMLRRLGLAAEPALVDTDARQQLDEWLPTPFAFDHAIVRATVDGQELWIDGTHAQQGGPLTTSPAPAFERALVVREGVTGLVPIPRAAPTLPTTIVEETYTAPPAGGAGRLEVLTTYTGADADRTRAGLDSQSADERARGYLNFYARRNRGIRAEAPPVVTDVRATNVVTVTERYELPQFWDEGLRRFRAWPVLDALQKPETTLRSQPLGVTHPQRLRYRVRLRGLAAPPDAPDLAVVEDAAFRFSRSGERSGGALTLTWDYETRADSVAPAAVANHLGHIDDVYGELDYTLDETAPLAHADGNGSGSTGAWLAGFACLAGVAFWLRVGVPWQRNRKRRRAFGRLLQYPSGATPETALRAPTTVAATDRVRQMACACGAGAFDDGHWSTFRYDGRVMSVFARECAACRQTQTVYFDLAAEA
jgi:transglutaminase-like putative cysteine protease